MTIEKTDEERTDWDSEEVNYIDAPHVKSLILVIDISILLVYVIMILVQPKEVIGSSKSNRGKNENWPFFIAT